MFEIDKSRATPEAALDFFSGDQLTAPLDEEQQYPERLGLKFQKDAALTQFPSYGVQFKCAKAETG